MQVLYLDPAHTLAGAGVIAYETNFDTAKIVQQEDMSWYEQVRNATWDDVELKMIHGDKKIIYEWRVTLKDKIIPGRAIGFDYAVYDKDTDQGWTSAAWGDLSIKHRSHKNLGDLIIMSADEKLGAVNGMVQWQDEKDLELPPMVHFASISTPDLFVQAKADSTGKYTAQLPVGAYQITLPDEVYGNWKLAYRVMAEPIAVTVNVEEQVEASPLVASKEVIADILPSRGILHDFDASKTDEIDAFITQYQEFYDIPGVSLALIRDGQVAYHKTYGVQNTITQEPLVEHSLFEAASITKPVFAYVVNRLAERSEFDLDKPLYEYLPFEDLKEYEDYKLMTGRHVLMHLSGLPNWGREMKNKPGTKYGYSGEGFEYLKRVVAHELGKDIQQILDEEVLEPLNLYNTYFADCEELRAAGVSGHYGTVPTPQYYTKEPGMAWSMFTEAKAFSRFAIAMLEARGLASETYKGMFTLLTEYPVEEGETKPELPEGMGLGIAIRESPFGQVFGHGGNNGDFKCHFEIYKDLKMGYVVFTNSSWGDQLNKDLPQFLVEGKKAALAGE
ncbi:MAG: serine hydrolase domain-containing protein, partial [Cyclobacteriaceae bacterium]